MTEPRIAFVGAGAIGLPMAARAATGGSITVVDVSPQRLGLARDMGLATATSLADALPAELVLLMVATAAQARAVLDGPEGLFRLAGPGTTIVILSTIGPDAARELEALRPAGGPRLLDVPVTGGVLGAEAGNLTLFAAGDAALLERHLPVLRTMGHVVHAGDSVGDGQAFKVVNQLLATSQLVVAAEALGLAERLGLQADRVYDAVKDGAGASWMLHNYGPRMLAGEAGDISARLDIFLKDCALVEESAGKVGFQAPVNQATRRVLERAVDLGHGADDASTVASAYRT